MKKVLETEKNGLTMDLATLAKVCTGDKTMDNELTTGVWGPTFQLSVDGNMKKKKKYNILHLHCHSKVHSFKLFKAIMNQLVALKV